MMTRSSAAIRLSLAFLLALSLPAAVRSAEDAAPADAAALPYLVCLDFASEFDDGKLGKQIGVMFRSKAHRKKVCQTDAEIEWDGGLSEAMSRPTRETPLEEIVAKAREAFGCDLLVWGWLEKAEAGGTKTGEHFTGGGELSHTTTVRTGTQLFLQVRAVDLANDPTTLAVDRTFILPSNYEVSPAVEEVIKTLTGALTKADIAAADPSNRVVATGPNLCPQGDLRLLYAPDAEPPTPTSWMARLEGWHFPMREGIEPILRYAQADLTAAEREWVVHSADGMHYTLSEPVAASTGLFCYSPYIPIEPQTYYQVSFRVRTEGPKVICFVKGYRDLELPGISEDGKPKLHRQETFKHQKRWYGEKGEWGTLTTKPFLPRSVKPEHMPQFLRVQLYAYWPKGEVEFDDVVVRKCVDPEQTEDAAASGAVGDSVPDPDAAASAPAAVPVQETP